MCTSKGWWSSAWFVPLALAAACGGEGPPSESAGPAGQRAADAGQASAVTAEDETGVARTVNASGGAVIDPDNPFFQPLGTNGRSCSTCHDAHDGMALTPSHVQARFEASDGTDPLFRTVDGSTSPTADVSTVAARRTAYRLLLERGLIRIGIGVPDDAEFELVAADDPYGFASAAELSLFRRPLPAANLRFLSTVMWDGRETLRDPSQATGFAPLPADLADQANSATLGHGQAVSPLTSSQRSSIVGFETQLFTAQLSDREAGRLDAAGALGGPERLSLRPFTFGVNDPLDGGPFDPVVFDEFEAWQGSPEAGRAAVARGEKLFNTLPISITGVSGLNDDLGQDTIQGTCTTCHDTPHAGDHSVPAPLRIGVDAPDAPGGLDLSGLPVYTLRNKATGEVKVTTDPGRALITGKWKDVGRFKGPILRGLAARAPYFHNGSARDLAAVVEFYDQRFDLHLTDQEKADLVAFLRSL